METNEKKAFLEELQKTPEIYVIMSVCTKMPYVYCEPESYDDQVFLFHKEEDAKKLVEDYRQHENPIVEAGEQTVPGLLFQPVYDGCQWLEH